MAHESVLPADEWMPAEAPWPRGVQAGITLRAGGHSPPPFDRWNLGDHVGDAVEAVTANRLKLAQALKASPVFCRQVHGTDVVELTGVDQDGVVADGAYTQAPAIACTMMVADCLPILFAAPDGSSVAAVHAGWRGLAGVEGHGVIESLAGCWPAVSSAADRARAVVWLGPCIGPRAFEVGEEVRAAFLRHDAAAVPCFTPIPADGKGPKYLADLPALSRLRLAKAGFSEVYGNDGSPEWCTFGQPSTFFSYRRDQARFGGTGRMAACIWRD